MVLARVIRFRSYGPTKVLLEYRIDLFHTITPTLGPTRPPACILGHSPWVSGVVSIDELWWRVCGTPVSDLTCSADSAFWKAFIVV